MTAAEAIKLKEETRERKYLSRKETWEGIQKLPDSDLRTELNKFFPKPVRSTNKRKG
jgi:hypothetical protein